MPDAHEQQRYFCDLAARLDAAPHGERSALLGEAAEMFGVGLSRIYAQLSRAGWTSGRKRRCDHGKSKVTVGEARVVANIITESTRATGKTLLSVEAAAEIARANGLLNADASASTIARVMEQHQFHPRQLKESPPHVEMRSLHPNHVWQFDVSVCVLFYLKQRGLAVMDEKKFYKNKPQNVASIANHRVLRYLVTDHYSGAFFVKYYLGAGETQELLFDFLMEAFAGRIHRQDPFKGVPYNLIWDAGSANQSHLIKGLLDQLSIHHQPHIPGNPRAKGQVERTHDLVESNFEGRLYMLNIQCIEQLNEHAHLWMRHYNGVRKHRRTRATRYGLWQMIRPEQLRECPTREICEHLLRTPPEPRTVRGDLTLQYKVPGYPSQTYSVRHVPLVRVGERLSVCLNPYRVPNVFVIDEGADGDKRSYECTPIERDAAGFAVDAPVFGESYRAAPDTATDQHRKAMRKEAYDAETQQEADKARAKRKPAFGGRIDPISYMQEEMVAHYMDRCGTPIEVPGSAQVELKPLTHMQAMKRLRSLLGRPIEEHENRSIRNCYPDGILEAELDRLVQKLRDEQLRTNPPVHQQTGG